MSIEAGVLYVVATPIGNMADITRRAEEILATVDVITAEDTRHTRQLLKSLQIDRPMLSLHEHNERERAPQIITRLKQGDNIALVSDAGTPLLSDPGYHLVHLAREQGIRVVPVPGASALLAALVASGMPSNRFVFEGFLPAKGGARRQRLEELNAEPRTIIIYEAPHRLLDTLRDMVAVFGPERHVILARELTKKFETFKGDGVAALLQWVEADENQQKGEMVLMVQGAGKQDSNLAEQEGQRVLKHLLEELPLSQASSLAAKITGCKKKSLYNYGLGLKKA